MIYMELAPSALLGLFLTMSGILLYIIRIKEKNLSRDYDLLFSSIGCLCGGILIFQGWRLDPILLLCQMMSGGTAIFFIGETIWLRNIDIKKEQMNSNAYITLMKKNKKTYHNDFYHILEYDKKKYQLLNLNIVFIDLDYTFPIDFF
jgi:hypothetical protein